MKRGECVADLPLLRHIVRAELPSGALDGLRKTAIRLEADLCLMLAPIDADPLPDSPPV